MKHYDWEKILNSNNKICGFYRVDKDGREEIWSVKKAKKVIGIESVYDLETETYYEFADEE